MMPHLSETNLRHMRSEFALFCGEPLMRDRPLYIFISGLSEGAVEFAYLFSLVLLF